jgi:two-component system, NarL family, nitrate/nitrite response regulator NarL
MTDRTTVLVADDHPLFRAGVAELIKREPMLDLVAECEDGHEALEQIRRREPQVVLLDLKLPGIDGFGVLDAIQREHLSTRAVVVSAAEDSAAVYRAIASGARAYVSKTSPPSVIRDAIAAVARGDTLIPAELQAGLASEIRIRRDHVERPILTARELEILRLAADGASNADIAERLHLSGTTVKTHLAHVYDKLEVPDRAAAVARAIRRGLLH